MKKKNFIAISSIILSLILLSSCAGPSATANSTDTTPSSTNTTKENTTKENTTQASKNVIKFDTTTVEGEPITSEIFKDYKITMINIWATWCDPCIAEMAELSKLQDELPEGSNLISFALDAGDDEGSKKDALDIIAEYNLKYLSVIPDANILKYVSSYITGIPTTIFVDRDGNIIGDEILGAPRGDIVKGYQKAIEERIVMVE